MSFLRSMMVVMLAAACSMMLAQTADVQAASPSASFTGTVRPALAQVGETLNQINIRKWKAPNEVRSAAQEDVSSIQRDLSGTLAGLLQQSDASPGSVPAAFAVYRNVNALYDTLLRVVETAGLAAPDKDVTALDSSLSQLESARNSLADQIMNGSEVQQSELLRLRTAVATAAAAPRRATTTVVEDGPAPETHHRRTARKHTTSEAEKSKEKAPSQDKTPPRK